MSQIIQEGYRQFRSQAFQLISVYKPEILELHPIDMMLFAAVATILIIFAVKFYSWPFYLENWINLKRYIIQNTILKFPIVKKEVRRQIEKGKMGYREGFAKNMLTNVYKHLGEKPMSWGEVDQRLAEIESKDFVAKKSGKVTGAFYTKNDCPMEKKVVERSGQYLYHNMMHYEMMYGLRQMEAELISMYKNLLNGSDESCGTFTSGGTESILQALFTLREYAKETKGITKPEIIMANTAHAAFNKACFYFNIKTVMINVDKKNGYVATAKLIEKKITQNTIGIVCSAGNYPHGLIEPVPEINKVAEKYNVPIHVDCCLGGYSMIFGRDIGNDVPVVDFRNSMVYSISIDPHKYGLAPKGASLVLFKNMDIKYAGIYVYDDWTGGIYGTVSLSGSRPGASMVGAWIASMVSGKEVMRENVKEIFECMKILKEQVRQIPDIEIIGDPILNVLCVASKADYCTDYMLSEAMKARDWKIQICQKPLCLHLALTLNNLENARTKFADDLRLSMIDVKKNPQNYQDSKMGQIYGSTAKAPDGIVTQQAIRVCISEFSFI